MPDLDLVSEIAEASQIAETTDKAEVLGSDVAWPAAADGVLGADVAWPEVDVQRWRRRRSRSQRRCPQRAYVPRSLWLR
jgi:hypothetical protein